ncbi:Peptide chain release factor RF2 [Stratiformator vulcanicus]|uniref:Peptide chain release factor 2 n=1 Tax=Stratiformator vulcanicus TaxID=2527980 RepID=A0A517R2E1_9PLAN|nr:Peptide chain release factor RF2 [Stratiformator vulcanicus]
MISPAGLSTSGTVFDYDSLQQRIREINERMAAADFWDDQESAQATVSELQRIQGTLKPLESLVQSAEDIEVMIELTEEDDSDESKAELAQTVNKVERDLEALEIRAIMRNPEDACDAFMSVQAGEGGTDAADFAEMLMRMYQRWGEQNEYKVSLEEISPGEEAGIRSATLHVSGDYAYGYLKAENGTHRLVRNSPFDSAGRRQTSFAAVDVTPDIGDSIDIDLNWDSDVREDTLRAGGAGGQHVNKTESAVRLTHLETGVAVLCQSERSQHQNRATARKMLTAKLYQLEVEKREADIAAKRGQKTKIGFGGETIRHYVLNPDQYVKDSRTGTKTGNPGAVLDGDLNEYIEAYLRWSISHEPTK